MHNDGTIKLNAEETAQFLHNLMHPSEENIKAREKFFKEIDETIQILYDDGKHIVVEVKNLNLDDLFE